MNYFFAFYAYLITLKKLIEIKDLFNINVSLNIFLYFIINIFY